MQEQSDKREAVHKAELEKKALDDQLMKEARVIDNTWLECGLPSRVGDHPPPMLTNAVSI